MLPKRKLIKKQFVAPQTSLNEEGGNFYIGDLIEQLKSGDSKIKADAISAIANIQSVSADLQQQLFSTNTLLQLTNVLTTGATTSLIQTALFAINNLCVHQATIVSKLFGLGLDKALMGLDTNDANILKPILILMTTIADYVPAQHKYLIQVVQNSIVSNCGKYLQEKYADLVMQFLIQSHTQMGASITPEQVTCIQTLQRIAQADKLYKNRALASRLQCTFTNGKMKQSIELFCANFEEFVTDIDLQREYKANFANLDIGQQGMEKGDDQDEEEEEMMVEEKNKKDNPKEQILSKQVEQVSPHSIFFDALQGIQVMLEFIVEQFEDEAGFGENEEEEEQMDEEEAGQQEVQLSPFDKSIFLPAIQISLNKTMKNLHKYASLSFIEGQNIIELVLRLLLTLPAHFTSKTDPHKIQQSIIVGLAQEILISQFKFEMNNQHRIPQQVFIFNANTALQVILKYKLIINRNIYIELPYLKYGSKQSQPSRVISVTNKWKQFWINLLEIYSLFYNPEKVACVTQKENKDIGATLKLLVMEIPELQLEEWRGQAIDTVFDVYSNENFDKIFMEYGFVDILTQVLKVATANSKSTKSKKTNKFITAVVSDIHRFIAYKKKMIGF